MHARPAAGVQGRTQRTPGLQQRQGLGQGMVHHHARPILATARAAGARVPLPLSSSLLLLLLLL
jgi:hypothetical protein